ncbi:basic region/leucine zipper motif 60 [Tasmannia lanceolata]|uniref:basic region/leucine zipper motif 60 n=1 Tax=Tasmannia lanceolata TaxID=3420 RepID=UPI004062E080
MGEEEEHQEQDWESLLQSIPDLDLFLDDFSLSTEPSIDDLSHEVSNPSPVSDPSLFGEVEHFLLEDDDEIVENHDFCNDFFSDVFIDVSDARSDEVRISSDENSTPEAETFEENEEKEKSDDLNVKNGGEDDSSSKKRKRQMRNRDSAMKSRERKRMYVRDLEMKTKYLEGECRRLDFALHCCVAENQVLHHRLQKEKVSGASFAKQESAVLLLESLLLGSLFWLVSIVCLFLLPAEMKNVRERQIKEGQEIVAVVVGKAGNEELGLGLGLVFMRRRCRATKRKMKEVRLPLQAVFG